MFYGAIEAGGTKFVCAVSDGQFEIIDRISIPTTSPTETLEQVFKFFDQRRCDCPGGFPFHFILFSPPGFKNQEFILCRVSIIDHGGRILGKYSECK